MSHNVHKFTLDVTYVQKGVQLVTKVCYYLEFSYIYKHLIINKKALCLIAEGCTLGLHLTNRVTMTYAVLFPCLWALATGRRRPRRGRKMGARTALAPDGVAEVFSSFFDEICCVDN